MQKLNNLLYFFNCLLKFACRKQRNIIFILKILRLNLKRAFFSRTWWWTVCVRPHAGCSSLLDKLSLKCSEDELLLVRPHTTFSTFSTCSPRAAIDFPLLVFSPPSRRRLLLQCFVFSPDCLFEGGPLTVYWFDRQKIDPISSKSVFSELISWHLDGPRMWRNTGLSASNTHTQKKCSIFLFSGSLSRHLQPKMVSWSSDSHRQEVSSVTADKTSSSEDRTHIDRPLRDTWRSRKLTKSFTSDLITHSSSSLFSNQVIFQLPTSPLLHWKRVDLQDSLSVNHRSLFFVSTCCHVWTLGKGLHDEQRVLQSRIIHLNKYSRC